MSLSFDELMKGFRLHEQDVCLQPDEKREIEYRELELECLETELEALQKSIEITSIGYPLDKISHEDMNRLLNNELANRESSWINQAVKSLESQGINRDELLTGRTEEQSKAFYESSSNVYVEDSNGDFRNIFTGLTEDEEKAKKVREARKGTILERLENTISGRVTGTLEGFEFTSNDPRYSSTPAKPVYKSKVRKARKVQRQAKKRGRK